MELHSLVLNHWMVKGRRLMLDFSYISFQRIFKELNVDVDRLSKRGIGDMYGYITFEVLWGGALAHCNALF